MYTMDSKEYWVVIVLVTLCSVLAFFFIGDRAAFVPLILLIGIPFLILLWLIFKEMLK